MEVEIFALCDAATMSGTKLNMLGVFDAIRSKTEPVVHSSSCYITARIRFERAEMGPKVVTISIIDADGKEVIPPLVLNIEVRFQTANLPSATSQFLLEIRTLTLPRFGHYQIDLAVDGRVEKSIPLFAVERTGRSA